MRDRTRNHEAAKGSPIANFNAFMGEFINLHKLGVLVSCCVCNDEERISQRTANELKDTDWWMCEDCS
jgi:hypothetical protein